jgi:predicted extracellular nuclease
MWVLRSVIVFFFVFPFNVTCIAQQSGKRLAVAFYNCENFFDTQDNPLKDDDEFTPGGKYKYTERIYRQKLHNIARVVKGMGDPKGLAMIGLAEVENSKVLKDLVNEPQIAARKYKYVWYDGPDPRGINVALIYDPVMFRLINSKPVSINIAGTGGKVVTRDALQATGVLSGDTVTVLVNHWPSRRGGDGASAPKRIIAANVNKNVAEGLWKKNSNATIIVMGDLNDNPDDESVTKTLGAVADKKLVAKKGFYNPYAAIYSNGGGTEVYRKKWNLYDQIIVSGSLVQCKNLCFDKAEVFKPDYIIDKYKGKEGEPYRSFKGTYWINGYSDHFPVIVYFTAR